VYNNQNHVSPCRTDTDHHSARRLQRLSQVGYDLKPRHYVPYVITSVIYFAIYLVVLIINALLIDTRDASNYVARRPPPSKSTTSSSPVNLVRVRRAHRHHHFTRLYVLLRGTVSVTSLVVNVLTSSVFLCECLMISGALSRF